MGRKLIGLSVGFLLTMAMAFFMIPVEYNNIILWLAPYLGPWLRFFLMYLFIIFAHPLTYTSVIVIWGVIGFIMGMFVRSFWGTIPVAIFIFGLTFLMLIVGIVAMVVPLLLSGGGGIDFLAMLSNIPPTVSLFDIIDAPVIGPLIDAATGGLEGLLGGGADPSALLTMLQSLIVNTIVLPAVLNFAVLLITAMIGGLIGRRIFPP